MRYAPKLVQRRSPVNNAPSEKVGANGAEEPGRKERVPLPKKRAARITPIPADETLFGMLLCGCLDTVMCAHKPAVTRGPETRCDNCAETVRR